MRLARRKTQRGGFVWCVVWQEAGKWQRVSLRTEDKREAERRFQIWLTERQTARLPDLTIADVWREYWENHGKDAVSARDRASVWRRLQPFFGDMLWDTISIDYCKQYTTMRIGEGVKPSTIWSELKTLRTALGYNKKRGLIPSIPHVWLPPTPEPRDRRMTREQCETLIAACEVPHIRLFVLLALTTAGRMSAILDLTWDRVDFERGLVHLANPHIARTKKGRASVPMNRTLRAALLEAREGALTDKVVEWGGKSPRSVQKGIQTVARKAGLPWVSAHVMRHTAATLMVESGVPIEMVGQYLGHSNIALTYSTYARFRPDAMRSASDALEFGMAAKNRRRA